MDLDGVKRFAELGVERIVVPPFGWDSESLKTFFGQFHDNVISKL
jgi:hypothetical protein